MLILQNIMYSQYFQNLFDDHEALKYKDIMGNLRNIAFYLEITAESLVL